MEVNDSRNGCVCVIGYNINIIARHLKYSFGTNECEYVD